MSKPRHYQIGLKDGKAQVAVIARRALDICGDTRLQEYKARLVEAQVKYPVGSIVEYESRDRGSLFQCKVLAVGVDAVHNVWLKIIPCDTSDEMMIDYLYPDDGCKVIV